MGKDRAVLLGSVILVTVGVAGILLGCGEKRADRTDSGSGAAYHVNPSDPEAFVKQAEDFLDEREYEKAVAALKKGLAANPESPRLIATLGYAHSMWGDSTYTGWAVGPESEGHYAEAEHLLRRAIALDPSDAASHRRLGCILEKVRRRQEAIALYRTALKLDPDNPDNGGRLGKALKADGRVEEALPILEKAVQQCSGRGHYWIWWALADCQRRNSDYNSAVATYLRARELAPVRLRKQLAAELGTVRQLAKKEKSWDAFHFHRLAADGHERAGRMALAIESYRAALEVLPQEPKGRQDRHRTVAGVYRSLAECFLTIEDSGKAVECAEQAVESAKKADDVDSLAWTYSTLTRAYWGAALTERSKQTRQRIFEKALKAAEAAQRYADQTVNAHLTEVTLFDRYALMAAAYGVDDERVKARRKEMAVWLPESGPLRRYPYDALEKVAFVEAGFRWQEGDFEGARNLYKRLVPYYATHETSFNGMLRAIYLYSQLGGVEAALGNFDKALEYGEMCLDRFDEVRSIQGVDKFRRSIGGERFRYVCNGLACLALEKGEKGRAFNFGERYKGRALLDLLGGKPPELKRRTLKALKNEKQTLLAQLDGLAQQLREAKSSGDTKNLRSIERTLSIEQNHHQRLAEDVSVAELEVASFASVDSVTWRQLQPTVRDFTLVSYVVGDAGIVATILSADGVEGVQIGGVAEDDICALVEAFRQDIGVKTDTVRDLDIEPDAGGEVPRPVPETTAADALYEALIEPVLPFIKTKLLYISPDDVLNCIPFEAIERSGRYLIEDFEIAYTPSGGVLKLCMDKERHGKQSVLALGNPNLRNPAFRLHHAQEEVGALQGLFPQVDVHVFDDATETVVKRAAADYDILHFACHGELNLDDPMLTSLRLTPDDANDGYLHAGEVFEQQLSASLVVLSACNSALGELTSGNELMGLTRSFLYAGTPSIIASLWTVDDRSTAYLMKEFYRNLPTMTKAEALRAAKLATMKEYPEPFHWAAFCLQGDYR